MNVSVLAQNLHGSEIIKIAGEINELKRQGQNIANLTIGDFDSNIYPIPVGLQQGIVDAYDQHQTNYPPADGMLDLRQSVSAFLKSPIQARGSTDRCPRDDRGGYQSGESICPECFLP